jgi:hypothetical protein
MERRHLRKLTVRLAAVALTAGLVVLAVTAIASGKPATAQKATACPFKGGQINMFMAQDLKAVIGEEIGPSGARAAQAWRDYTNAHGGILGCKFAYVAKDETFGDIPAGLRLYRDAIASKKYDFFLGPTNSALMAALPDLTNAAGKPIISGIASLYRRSPAGMSPNVSSLATYANLQPRMPPCAFV